MNLPEISVKRPVTIFMIVLATCFLGVSTLLTLKVELMPNISSKKISIIVGIRGGMPPTEIESLVIKPVEDAVSSVPNLESIYSLAEKDRAIVTLKFIPGTNMDFASLSVNESFAKIKNKLPKSTEKPVISKYEESDAPIMTLAVTSVGEVRSTEEIRTIVEEMIKEKLMRVSGVANIGVSGGRLEKIICNMDKNRIQANKIPIRQIVSKIGAESLNVQVGSRNEDIFHKGIVLETEFENLNDIENTAIKIDKDTGTQILVKDIGTVKRDYLEAQNISRYTQFDIQNKDKKESSEIVSLYIQKESTGNTVLVSEEINSKLKEIEIEITRLYPDLRILTVNDQASFILEAISKVKENLLQGSILAFLVLLFFLRDIFTSLVVGVSIPVSILMTFICMSAFDIPINIMTLLGLTLAAGMLLDGSICVVENIFGLKNKGENAKKASIEGTSQVALEIVAGTLTTIVVFFPILFVAEQIQRLYLGLALTVIFSLVASLFVALSVIPTLSARFTIKEKKAFAIITNIKLFYIKSLSYCLRYRYVFILFTFAALAFSLVTGKFLKQELAGSASQNRFTVYVELPDGAKLEISDAVVAEVETYLKAGENFPEIQSVTSRVEGWSSKIYVELHPPKLRKRSPEEIIDVLRTELPKLNEMKKIPGSFVYFSQDSSGDSEDILLDIYGYDYDILSKLANEVAGKLEEIEGMKDAKLATTEGRPEFQIMPKLDTIAQFGLTVKEVAETIHTQIRGLRATAYHPKDGSGREIETLVRLDPKYVKGAESVRDMTVMSPKGQLLFLKELATFQEGLSPSEISRTNKSRMIQVSVTSTKLGMEEAVPLIREKLLEVTFPKEYYYEFSGAYYKLLESKKQLTYALFATVILVYMVMACLFESYAQPIIIMTTVPLALIGAILALAFAKKSVTLSVFIGGIMLMGMIVNSAILLVSTINSLREQKSPLYLAIIKGSLMRTRPILMTSITSVVGLFPMAMDQSQYSNLYAPLAITVIGGMISATLLTLYIVPCFFATLEQFNHLLKRYLFK